MILKMINFSINVKDELRLLHQYIYKKAIHILYSVDMHTTKIEFIEFIIDDMV